MAKLKDLAEQGGWFSDVLADTDIFLGIRNNVLDAYWHGCRLFHVTRKGKAGPLKVATHPKYLIDPGLGGEIVLTDINFGLGEHAAFIEFVRRHDNVGTHETGCETLCPSGKRWRSFHHIP